MKISTSSWVLFVLVSMFSDFVFTAYVTVYYYDVPCFILFLLFCFVLFLAVFLVSLYGD